MIYLAMLLPVLLTVLLTVLTVNFFSVIGVFLLHFWVFSALLEGVVLLVGKLWKNHPAPGAIKFFC